MSRVHVVVVSSEHEETSLQMQEASLREYVDWIPSDCLVGQLKQDVGRYWQIKTTKYDLYDALDNVLDDDTSLECSNFDPCVLTLKKRERVPTITAKTSTDNTDTLDPFWIHDQLFDLFVFNALQNRHSSTLRVSSFQFKQLLPKATAKSIYQQQKKLLFDKQVALAFRGALSNLSNSGEGISGTTFDEFLDALVDVACFMYPKELSKELSLEKLALKYIIPYNEVEQCAAGPDTLAWNQIEELVGQEKVKFVAQRFAETVGELATSYSANVGLANRCCVLGYHEFLRFVRDVIPTTEAKVQQHRIDFR